MLTHLSIHHLRNLQSVSIEVGQCNVFIGANGSGKTSLLESLHLLSRGKSFRHAQPKRYISHHCPHVTVHGKFADGNSMAIQKHQDASTLMRLDQQPVYIQSPLAKRLPTLLIDPSSLDLLEIGSSSRRQLLDWIAFHVKPGFHPQWLAYQRLLRQRNALLKQTHKLSGVQQQELQAWDDGLASHAALITHYRQQVFDAWQPLFAALIAKLLPQYADVIQLRFLPGYNTELPLNELLKQRLEQDVHLGYTRIGCHRSDIQVLWLEDKTVRLEPVAAIEFYSDIDEKGIEPHPSEAQTMSLAPTKDAFNTEKTIKEQAANVLSRGEKKLLITALRLSQLPLLTHPDNLVLQDDLAKNDLAKNEPPENKLEKEEKTAPPVTLPIAFHSADKSLPLVLLDDITAELDDNALTILLETLATLSCQVFVTSLDASIVDKLATYWQHLQVFHVKQGEIHSIKNKMPLTISNDE